MTDFNAGKDELRCFAPWRPWVKKYKIQWQEEICRTGRYRWVREVHELLPNLALETHVWLGSWFDMEGRDRGCYWVPRASKGPVTNTLMLLSVRRKRRFH